MYMRAAHIRDNFGTHNSNDQGDERQWGRIKNVCKNNPQTFLVLAKYLCEDGHYQRISEKVVFVSWITNLCEISIKYRCELGVLTLYVNR